MATPLIVQTTDVNLRVLNPNDHPEGVLIVPPGLDVEHIAFHTPTSWAPSDDVPTAGPPSQCGSTDVHPPHDCAGLDGTEVSRFCGQARRGIRFAACDLPPLHAGTHHCWYDDGDGGVTVVWEG